MRLTEWQFDGNGMLVPASPRRAKQRPGHPARRAFYPVFATSFPSSGLETPLLESLLRMRAKQHSNAGELVTPQQADAVPLL